MPRVTAIERQKKQTDRYSIFIDGTFCLSLSDMELLASGLRVGQELRQQDIEQYNSTSQTGKALNSAYKYLSYRPRSVKEVKDHLNSKYGEFQAVEEAVEKLISQKYLDDNKFAISWVAERQEVNPSSIRKLRMELLQKGIDKEIVGTVLSKIQPDDQALVIKKLIMKKRLRTRYSEDQKLIRYLSSQGFHYAEIKQALEELVLEPD